MIAARILRRAVRKATKRPRLWLNAWQYKRSESEVCRLQELRTGLIEAERAAHIRQVALPVRRGEIAGW